MANLLLPPELRDQPELQGRRIGLSTSQALSILADAIRNPGKRIEIRDHYSSYKANEHLYHMLRDMVRRLELQHIEFRKTPHELRFFITSNHITRD